MLIVPADRKFDLRQPPVVTILIAFVCFVIYAAYQSGDDARAGAAVETYLQQDLLKYEAELLQSFAAEQEAYADYEPETARELVPLAVMLAFDAYVREYWDAAEPADEWQQARQAFEAKRNRISSVRYGLVPAEVKPAGLFGHMFMHGGWDHLIGNLIFLILLGIALERVIGPLLFLATYIVTGLAAGGLFVAVDAGSYVPLVGASGAISGLMGAYVGVYGMRRIQFFYTVGFWFGRFVAPALLIFPLWLAKEIYGHFYVDSPVAYMAHAGGLLGGLAIALLLRKPAAQVIEADDETRRTAQQREEKLRRIRQLMTDLRLEDAARLAEQSVVAQPDETAYWLVYAEVADRMPPNAEYHRIIATIFANAMRKSMPADFLRELLKSYAARQPQQQMAAWGKGGVALAKRFFREGSMRDVDNLLDAIHRSGKLGAEFGEFVQQLLQLAEKNKDMRRAERFRRYLAATVTPEGA